MDTVKEDDGAILRESVEVKTRWQVIALNYIRRIMTYMNHNFHPLYTKEGPPPFYSEVGKAIKELKNEKVLVLMKLCLN